MILYRLMVGFKRDDILEEALEIDKNQLVNLFKITFGLGYMDN